MGGSLRNEKLSEYSDSFAKVPVMRPRYVLSRTAFDAPQKSVPHTLPKDADLTHTEEQL